MEWRWQYVFPQEGRWKNAKIGEEGPHHADELPDQKAVREACFQNGSDQARQYHTFPPFFRHAAFGKRV